MPHSARERRVRREESSAARMSMELSMGKLAHALDMSLSTRSSKALQRHPAVASVSW